jgi:hypothetical protein
MTFILLLFTLIASAEVPQHWAHILEVTDRHEFYRNHEPIIKPAQAWQTLFAVTYLDTDLVKLKDCVIFKVPGGTALGTLKLKTIPASMSCDDYLLKPGDFDIPEIKSLQFATDTSEAEIDFSTTNFKLVKWKAGAEGKIRKTVPTMFVSSAEARGSKVILLAPKSNLRTSPLPFLKDKTLCHGINDDCTEVGPSECERCERGWYEIPNGCKTGPKYCGTTRCGGLNQPACRRGRVWQKSTLEMDCRTNSSFAYCHSGLEVSCEGRNAFCR